MTPDQALEKEYELKGWIALGENPAFQVYVEKVNQAYDESLKGLSNRAYTAIERSQHVEAFHLAEDLKTLRQSRIDLLEKQLLEFRASQADMPPEHF